MWNTITIKINCFTLEALKITDLVDLKTALIVDKARNNLLPSNLQNIFKD